MEALDEERLMDIMQTTVEVVLGNKKEESISSTLLDIDEHVRQRLISDLTTIFRRGMALHLDLEAFDNEINNFFSDEKLLSRALHAFWKKKSEECYQRYLQSCPFDNRLIDLKWVAKLPTESKYGTSETSPSIECRFETTQAGFDLTLTNSGINNLLEQLQNIQNEIQNLK